MKRKMISVLCIVYVLVCAVSYTATAKQTVRSASGYQYVLLKDGTAEIRKYTKKTEELIEF